jgi:hypothetical protein
MTSRPVFYGTSLQYNNQLRFFNFAAVLIVMLWQTPVAVPVKLNIKLLVLLYTSSTGETVTGFIIKTVLSYYSGSFSCK